jgi:tRNA pseudouridine55 synthase
VRVERLDLESYGFPHLRVRVVCSSGTYIRALAADLGTGLGCGAYVHSLRRLRVGRLDLSRALTLEEVAQVHCRGELAAQLVEPQLALDGLERVELAPEALRSFVRGRAVALAPPPESGDGVVAVYGREQVFYGLGRWLKEKQVVQPVRVLRDGVPAEHG